MNVPPLTVAPAYLELIRRFPLRPLRSDADYDAAVAVMNSLIDGERSPDEEDYLQVLGSLVREYDEEHHALPAASQGDILRLFLDDRGISQAELARGTGIPESSISAMLKGTRGIGKNARATLARFLEVEPTDFVVE